MPHPGFLPRPERASFARYAAAGMLAFFTIHVRAIQPLHPIDDAHITFRHVSNFLEGHGWVFNAGDGFLSSSAPLYMLLLTAVEGMSRTGLLPSAAAILNGCLDAATVVLAYLGIFASDRAPARAFFFALPLALYPRLLDYSGCGMESSLFTFLILAAGLAWSRGRWNLAGGLFGAVFLTRPDGILCAAAALALSRREPGRAMRAAAWGAAVAAPWLAYAVIRYGSPFPATISNKAHVGAFWNPPTLSLLFAETSPWARALPEAMALRGHPVAAFFGALWAGSWAVALARLGREADRRLGAFCLLALALFLGAYTLGNPPLFGWYQVPLGVLLLVASGLGMQSALDRTPLPPGATAAAAVLCLALLAGWGRRLNYQPAQAARFTLIPDWQPEREQDYRRVGEWLRGAASPADAVLLMEAGTVGYYSGIRTIDGTGLTSPEYNAGLRAGRIGLAGILGERRPRWLLLGDDDFAAAGAPPGYRVLPISRRLRLPWGQKLYGLP